MFAATKEVSLLLQSKTTMLQDAMQQASVAARYLQGLRSTEAFSTFYKCVVELSAECTGPTVDATLISFIPLKITTEKCTLR